MAEHEYPGTPARGSTRTDGRLSERTHLQGTGHRWSAKKLFNRAPGRVVAVLAASAGLVLAFAAPAYAQTATGGGEP